MAATQVAQMTGTYGNDQALRAVNLSGLVSKSEGGPRFYAHVDDIQLNALERKRNNDGLRIVA